MARVRDLERRMKVVRLPVWYFVDCLIINAWAPGDCVTKLSLEGVPEDTIVVHAAPHHIDNTVAVVLYNEQWELIPEAQLLPTIDARPSHVLVNASVPRAEEVRQPIQSGVANVARDSLHAFLMTIAQDTESKWIVDHAAPAIAAKPMNVFGQLARTTAKLTDDGQRVFLDTVPAIELGSLKPADPFTADWSSEKPDDSWRDRKPLL